VGFFIRKSVRLGPVRFNLSRSGIGTSIGVRGLRVGQDARGHPYLFAGRGGLYYRERLGGAGSRPRASGCLVLLAAGGLVLVFLAVVLGSPS
jgi:hypothetical protein